MRLFLLLLLMLPAVALMLLGGCGEEITHDRPLTIESVRTAQALVGLDFDDAERELMLPDLEEQREALHALRLIDLPNPVPPALVLRPWPAGFSPADSGGPRWSVPAAIERPQRLDDLAFATIGELAELIRTRQVTARELTELSLARLEEFGDDLECVVSLPRERALAAADRADAEIAAGRYRGPLHGIPYGVKDLLEVEGTRTTWGAEPYRDQCLEGTATVVERLDAAGAVLVAKLTLGALAWGDVWYGGRTRNPWNRQEGSSGSSAGPASAVAAGLVPLSIGSETWGSIVSPATRCGVTGLRPTFGRVSRAGAMALSWSMDKLGPMARRVEDCALVLEAIRGPDGRDATVVEAGFAYRPRRELRGLRVGYLPGPRLEQTEEGLGPGAEELREAELYDAALEALAALGAELVPLAPLDFDAMPLSLILSVEAAAAFEKLTLTDRDDLLVRQGRFAWPNVFRAAQFIPAVAYVQANRARTLLIEKMARRMETIDLYVGLPYAGDDLLVTNLTGHPSVTLPIGMLDEDSPHSITFTGQLFGEARLLAAAGAWQEATGHHRRHPTGYELR